MYNELHLADEAVPLARAFIRENIEVRFLREIHALLRLPHGPLNSGGHSSVAHALLAVVSGVSVHLHVQASSGSKKHFINCLVRHYPWRSEPTPPTDEVSKRSVATVLYEEFRNPLAHNLGIQKSEWQYKLKRARLGPGAGPSEEFVDSLERDTRPEPMSSALMVAQEKRVLYVDALYWGIRQMIQRLSADRNRMRTVEAALSQAAAGMPK